MSPFIVYLVLMLDGLVGVLTGLSIVSLVLFILAILCIFVLSTDGCSGDCDRVAFTFCKKHIIKIFFTTLFLSIITIATPSTKQMCSIYLIPQIVNNERVQNIGDKSLTVIENKFEEWLNETIKNKEEE